MCDQWIEQTALQNLHCIRAKIEDIDIDDLSENKKMAVIACVHAYINVQALWTRINKNIESIITVSILCCQPNEQRLLQDPLIDVYDQELFDQITYKSGPNEKQCFSSHHIMLWYTTHSGCTKKVITLGSDVQLHLSIESKSMVEPGTKLDETKLDEGKKTMSKTQTKRKKYEKEKQHNKKLCKNKKLTAKLSLQKNQTIPNDIQITIDYQSGQNENLNELIFAIKRACKTYGYSPKF